jgi:hypothetical protein
MFSKKGEINMIDLLFSNEAKLNVFYLRVKDSIALSKE